MDKMKVTIEKPDGTKQVIEGSPEDVARILRELDREQLSPQPTPTIIVIPAPEPVPNPYMPYPWVQPIWAPSPTIAPYVPGWPIVTCQNTSLL